MLSIVILLCDKDYQFLPNILSDIQKFVLCNHEIILIDNRSNPNVEQLQSQYPDIKVYTKGYNCYLFEGRRFGFSKTKGDFIWNIDVDDNLLDYITESDLQDFDLLQLGYVTEYGKYRTLPPLHLKASYNLDFLGRNVWSRIFSRNILEKAYSVIDKEYIVFNWEDLILTSLIRDNNPTVGLIQKCVYQYNIYNSSLFVGEMTKERRERLDFSFDVVKEMISLIKDEKLKEKALHEISFQYK